MLANNFMAPAALGISDVEFDALRKVLGMLERGEIRGHQFDMRRNTMCESAACIIGWARHINPMAFTGDIGGSSSRELLNLFAPITKIPYYEITPDQGATALRNYLTLGSAYWSEALAA